MVHPKIFKAYDIRGVYPTELDALTAEQIGIAVAAHFKPKTLVVGRDVRKSQAELFPAFLKGVTSQGVNVIDVGLTSTPIFYYAVGSLGADLGVMVTASHNPPQYNGFKICKAGAVPVSGPDGIYDLRDRIVSNRLPAPVAKTGSVEKKDILVDYAKLFLDKSKRTEFKVVADTANAMGVLETKILEKRCNLSVLFAELDGSAPNHPANPLEEENMRFVQDAVRTQKADLGIAFDGDADRVMFTDENGDIVPSDIMHALLVRFFPKQTVLFDVRSTRAIAEEVAKHGGRAVRCRVGHAFIKKQMREENAAFAAELSGHYYYKEFFVAESSVWTSLLVLRLLSETGKPLSELAKPVRRYFQSGEINSEVEDKDAKMKELETKYKKDAKRVDWLDGVTIEFVDWWFNVRASNTEPLLRLNLEANSKELMERKRDEVLKVIRNQ